MYRRINESETEAGTPERFVDNVRNASGKKKYLYGLAAVTIAASAAFLGLGIAAAVGAAGALSVMSFIGLANTTPESENVLIKDDEGNVLDSISVTDYQPSKEEVIAQGESIEVTNGPNQGTYEFGKEYDLDTGGEKIKYERVPAEEAGGNEDTIRVTITSNNSDPIVRTEDASEQGWNIIPERPNTPSQDESAVITGSTTVTANGQTYTEGQRVDLDDLAPENGSAEYVRSGGNQEISAKNVALATAVPAAAGALAYGAAAIPDESRDRNMKIAQRELARTANMSLKLPPRQSNNSLARG